MKKAYSYRFYPTPEQESLLPRTAGCVRLVYNKALHERTQAGYERQERIGYSQTSSTNFFAGSARYPNFKKKHQGGSVEFTKSAFKFKNGQIYLAKCLDHLPIRWSRQIPSDCEPSTVTVKLHPSGRW
jgi:putative transposase